MWQQRTIKGFSLTMLIIILFYTYSSSSSLSLIQKPSLLIIQDLILHQPFHNLLPVKQPQSWDGLDHHSLMFPQRILRILPGGPISSHDDIIRQSCLLALLLKDGIKWLDCLAVRTPVRAVLIFFAGDKEKSLGRGFG